MDDSWLSILALVILLLMAAYLALAETAFASVSKIRIKSRADKGDKSAERAMKVLDNFDKAITTILIGTNITHLSAASLTTLMATRAWGMSAVAVTTFITTLVVFFAGEMLPKSIGKKYSERFSLALAPSLCFLMTILSPVSYVLTAIGTAAAKLTKGDPELTVTEDELYDIIENMKDEGELDAERGELVHSALVFADVTVESVLTARVDVKAVDIEKSAAEVLAFIKEQRHSRLPVYRDNIDNIIGVLQIRKYIKAWLREDGAVNMERLLDEAYFVHSSTNIDELLREMSRKKLNMAIVTDSYGGTLGIVTVEDILEELVGEIWDEDDEIVESFRMLGDGSFELNPGLSVEEAFELMDFEDPEDFDFEHKLLGEWAYEQFDLLPDLGDSFEYNGLEVTVSEKRQHRITKLTARVIAPKLEGGKQA